MGKTFDEWNYIIDSWGLFNPPGLSTTIKIQMMIFYLIILLEKPNPNNLGKVGFAFYILLINKNPEEAAQSGVREPANISLL